MRPDNAPDQAAEPAAKSEEARFSIGLPAALAAWVDVECARRGISRRQFIKLALQAFRAEPARGPAARKPRRGPAARQSAFLEQVRKVFGASLAMDQAGLEYDEVSAWMADEAFLERFTCAQEAFLERVEADLLAVGRGAQKGVTAALSAFLEAHHPSYGRLRIEQLVRHVGPLIESFYDTIREMAGDKLGEAIVKRLRELSQRSLAGLSD